MDNPSVKNQRFLPPPLTQGRLWKRIASQSADWLAMTGFFDSLNMPPAYFLNVSTLSVNASRCHLSQRERQGQAAPQPFNVPAAYIVRIGTQGQIFHTSYR